MTSEHTLHCQQPSIRNSSDIVQLNVGGEHFSTCISTLTTRSPYFEAMFSRHWTNHNDENDDYDDNLVRGNELPSSHLPTPSQQIFIDKDPTAFKYILNYMREGYMNLPKDKEDGQNGNIYNLIKNIITQAQYFGLDDFLFQVKVKTVKNCILHGQIFNFELDDSTRQTPLESSQMMGVFDAKYENLIDAFDDGCLPYHYLERYRDQVNLQVGDVKYTLNKSKLRAKSQLIAEMIDADSIFESSRRTYFIDQDPEVFNYLLHFIRYSQIDLPNDNPCLFGRVLHCAEFLKMDDFIILVKARTVSNLERHEAPMGADFMDGSSNYHLATKVEVTDIDRRNAEFFDRRFRSINEAINSNTLPDRFFNFSINTDKVLF